MDDASRTFERLRPCLMGIPYRMLASTSGAEQIQELADDLIVSFLTSMERLPPEIRTAFLLSEMFDVYPDVLAPLLGKSEAECRQAVQVARAWLRQERPLPSGDPRFRLLSRFVRAVATGDMNALSGILSDDAVVDGDGGGKVLPFTVPLRHGRSIAQLLLAAVLYYGSDLSIEIAPVDGRWGLLFRIDGVLDSVHSCEIDADRIVHLAVRRIAAMSD